MSHPPQPVLSRDERPIKFLFENSLFLILGTVAALIWANWSSGSLRSYDHFFHRFQLKEMIVDIPADQKPALHTDLENGLVHHGATASGDAAQNSSSGDAHANDGQEIQPALPDPVAAGAGESTVGAGPAPQTKRRLSIFQHPLTWEFIINDILMAFFFAIAAKEVWESLLPGGALHNPLTAAMPLVATLGGLIGPVTIYLAGCWIFGRWDSHAQGWAIPCATDIAFSYLAARLIFGAGHPVIAFLLLLAIADDAAGLFILAIFYPTDAIDWSQLWLAGLGMGLAFGLARLRVHSFWWYLAIPGALSWLGFYWAHLHPALGLVPIIPFLPHAGTDLGTFAIEELNRNDTLSEFEAWWKNPVEIILGRFGLANAGVALSSMGMGTFLVLAGLLVGKPLGIVLFTKLGQRFLGLKLPQGIGMPEIFVMGIIASIGFTVALFMSTAAFAPSDPELPTVKMGALLSFVSAILAWIAARLLKLPRIVAPASPVSRPFH